MNINGKAVLPLLVFASLATAASAFPASSHVRAAPRGNEMASVIRAASPSGADTPSALRPDFNGDGYGDLAVGSFGEVVDGKEGAGSVNVIYGSSTGLQTTGNGGPNDQYFTASTPGMPGPGAGKDDAFGSSDEPGDFNGDGYADLAIGIRGASCGTIGEAGAFIVLFGGPSGLSTAGSQYWNQNSPAVKDQCEKSDHLASSLTHGDFNNDGYDDLAGGADFEGFGSLTKVGGVNVLYGSASGLQATGTGGPDDQFWSLNSPNVPGVAADGDRFGRQVAGGDFNADGYEDLAINAVFKNVGGVNHAGTVSVIYGSATGLQATSPRAQIWSESTRGMSTGGAQADDRFGASIMDGDLNGDGYADLAVGIRLKDVNGVVDAGALSMIYGSATGLQNKGQGGPDDQFWTQDDFVPVGPGAQADAWFGYSVSVGDFNGDGFGDVIAGARFEDVGGAVDAGAVEVIYGSSSGLTTGGNQYFDQSSPGMSGQGAQAGAEFGLWSADSDFNGDGFEDTVVTAWLEDLGALVDAGAANAMYGSAGTGLSTAGSQFLNQNTPGMEGVGAQANGKFGWEDGAT
jgi:hypothetical protein